MSLRFNDPTSLCHRKRSRVGDDHSGFVTTEPPYLSKRVFCALVYFFEQKGGGAERLLKITNRDHEPL